MVGDHLEQRHFDARRVEHRAVAVAPWLFGQVVGQLLAGRDQPGSDGRDIVDLDTQPQARDGDRVRHLDQLHPRRVAIPEDPATALTITGGPLAGDRPPEEPSPELARVVEAIGEPDHTEFHRRIVAQRRRVRIPAWLVRSGP